MTQKNNEPTHNKVAEKEKTQSQAKVVFELCKRKFDIVWKLNIYLLRFF